MQNLLNFLLHLSILTFVWCGTVSGGGGIQQRIQKNSIKKPVNRMVKRFSTTLSSGNTIPATTIKNDDDKIVKNIFNLTVNVGDSVILKCSVDSNYENNAGVIWIQGKFGNVLTLNNNRITEDARFDVAYKQENNNQNFNLILNNAQFDDDNEYACETSSNLNNNEQTTVHSLIYLRVTQSPNFIEEKTSDNTISVNENTNLKLKCYAYGRPMPTIKWYRLSQDGTTDLNYESNVLELPNLTFKNRSIYECVANNGVQPSVSKKFTITVLYAPHVHAIHTHIHHAHGQSASIGCIINSNPQSTILWYKNEKPIIQNQQDTKYEIITFNQINQTVTYLKINSLKNSDFGNYTCEAFNSVGKNFKPIQLLETKLPHHNQRPNHNHHNSVGTDVDVVETTPYLDLLMKSDYIDDNNDTINDVNNNRKATQRNRKSNKTLLEYKIKTNYIKNNNEQYQPFLHGNGSSNTCFCNLYVKFILLISVLAFVKF